MGQQNSKEKLFMGIIKVNIYSAIFATITGIITDLFIGMISFTVYIHLIGALPVILGLERFSEEKIFNKLVYRLK